MSTDRSKRGDEHGGDRRARRKKRQDRQHRQTGTGDGDSNEHSQILEIGILRDRLMDALESDPDLASQVTEVQTIEQDCFVIHLANDQKFVVGVYEDRSGQ